MSKQSLGTNLVALSDAASQKFPLVELRVRQCLIDWAGVIFGAVNEASPLDRTLTNTGTATDFLAQRMREPADAAFSNAFRSHQLDFDDFHLEVPGHASAAVVGGALAIAESRNASLGELLKAVTAGVEGVTLLGGAYGGTLFARGWHPTAVLGSVGTAIAVSHLLKLSPAETLNAVGLASLQSSGSMAGFGSIGKPWQVGAAARNGVHAALAASALDVELPDYFSDQHGVFGLMVDEFREPVLVEKQLPRIADTQFKYFASCFGTHAAIRAARTLRGEHRLAPEDISTVEIGVGPDFEHVVINPGPQDIYEAKFSVSGTVALTLVGAAPTVPNFFSEKRRSDPEYQRLERNSVVFADSRNEGGGAVVRLKLASGEELEHWESESAPPSATDEAEAVNSKFLELAAPVLGSERADMMLNWLNHASLETSVSELTKQVME